MQIPHAHEAEAAVLGAVLLRNEAFDADAVCDLQPDDFHRPAHAAIWGATRTLLHGGHPVDVITLEDQLKLDDSLGLVGGLEALGALTDRFAATHNVSEHARIVAAKARARRAQAALAAAADSLGTIDADDIDEAIATVQRGIAELQSGGGAKTFVQVADAAIEQARKREAGTIHPFSWGLETLDEQFDGGLMPGELCVVAGRPGMGKTVLALQAAFRSGERGEVPLVFMLEMMEEQLGRRAIASRGRINNKDAKLPKTDNAWARMLEARESFKGVGGEVRTGRVHLDQVVARARAWRRRTTRPGPIVIDYLQLLEVLGHGKLDTRSKVEIITRALKLLAMELKVPVILLSQLNRGVEARDNKRPRASDLRDSGSIEQDADSVVLLYREAVYESGADPYKAEIIIPKCREGVPGTVHACFEGHFSRFLDVRDNGRHAPGMVWRG